MPRKKKLTVKKRLMLATYFNIAILFLMGILFMGGGYWFFFNDEAESDRPDRPILLFELQDDLKTMVDSWEPTADRQKIVADAGAFFNGHDAPGIELLVSRNGQELFRQQAPGASGGFPAQNKPHVSIDGSGQFFVAGRGYFQSIYNTGDYSVTMAQGGFNFERILLQTDRVYIYSILTITGLVAALLLMNLFTNKFVMQYTGNAIDRLAHGVRQIREGNLDYRITVSNNDEFSQVSADFNDMAAYLKESVERSQRDEQSRKELIAGISHDLRTPLTSVKAYLEGLQSGVASTPEAQDRYFSVIRDKVDDLDHMIEKLFIFSKLDTGQYPLNMELADLGQVAGAYLESVRDEYRQKGLALSLARLDAGLTVRLDAVHLQNIIINILENSLKYKMRETVTMRVSCQRADGGVRLVFADDGPGVPEAELEKIFDLFYRCDTARSNTGQGSGLGLAVCASAMARMRGRVHAQASPWGGLSIVLEFPSATETEHGAENINS